MKFPKIGIVLLAVLCIAVFAVGCTSTQTSSPSSSAQTAATTAAQVSTTASPALTAAASPAAEVCPVYNGKGIFEGTWDTRALGISNSIDDYVKDGGWEGSSYWAPKLVLSQNCWNVTGTYDEDQSGMGPFVGTIRKDPITGAFVVTGTWANRADASDPGRSAGEFTITMSADNQSFKGYLLVIPPDSRDVGSYPPNWAGKKI